MMEMKEGIMVELLKKYNEKFFLTKPYAYVNNINAFNDYIKSKGITEDNLITYLRGIRTENIKESLEYYINKNSITSKETAHKYKTALKEYLYFILDTKGVNNFELLRELDLPTYKENSYLFKMNNYIFEHLSLKDKEEFEVLTTEEVVELIVQCNTLLSSNEEFIKASKSQKFFNKYRSALIVKLILLTGMAYRTVLSLELKNLDIKHGIIIINGFEVRLPKVLQINIELYLELCSEINPNQEKLFIEFDGNPMSNKTSTLFIFIRTLIGRGDLNGILKYTIIKMIQAGISEDIIKRVTGVKNTIISDCVVRAFDYKTATRHLDSKVRSLEIYDKL